MRESMRLDLMGRPRLADLARIREDRHQAWLRQHLSLQREKIRQLKDAVEARRSSREEAIIKIRKNATKLGCDPVEFLVKQNKNKWAIRLFHDDYVAWTKRQPDYEAEICSICIEPCTEDESYTECGHLFHKDCIDQWNNKNGCPNCRTVCC